MAKLNTYVHVHDEDGLSHAFGPDDTLPDWAVKRITNRDVWAQAPAEDASADSEGASTEESESEPVEIPEGDITEDWTVKQLKAYAKSEDIDLGGATTKADILAKIAG